MSIASQLQAYQNGLTDAYNMVSQRGGTMPVHKNMSSLASSIATIPSGGEVGIPREVDANGVYGFPTQSFTFSFPSNATSITGQRIFREAFYKCTTLTSVDASSLTDANGSYAFAHAFYNCTALSSADFGSLETIGEYSFYYAFYGCTSLTSLDLSSLKVTTGGSALYYAFYGCTSLASVDLSSLTELYGVQTFYGAFYNCTSLTSVDFSSLATISGGTIMSRAFYNCTSLRTLSFPALLPDGIIGTVTNQFDGMLSGCHDVTVHFKSAMQQKIGSWTSVQNGFNGTNTTVLFDL